MPRKNPRVLGTHPLSSPTPPAGLSRGTAGARWARWGCSAVGQRCSGSVPVVGAGVVFCEEEVGARREAGL